jgi:protein-L-isoaspartate O-methyltransferase
MGKGWFVTDGRPGDRTLGQQLVGLDMLFSACKGRTVLDVGCAEGLISIELAKRGALAVHGVEIVKEHVEVGNKLRGGLPVTLEVGDANTWKPRRAYDYVVMLALLQKVRDPSAVCARMVEAARIGVVLRLPPENAPTIIDARSGMKPHYIGEVMRDCGFKMADALSGTFGEHISYWHRTK